MSCTGRADQADGFGRLYRLIFDFNKLVITNDRLSVLDNLLSSLLESVRDARGNLSLAVGHSPLHGDLIALRYFASFTYASAGSINTWRQGNHITWRTPVGVW